MEQDSAPRQPRLLTISALNFLSFLDTNLVLPVMALYAATLGVGLGAIGLIIGLYSLTNTPANIFSGRLIDRLGYRLPLVAGLVGGTLSMFSYAHVRLPVHLALVRLVHGFSGGLKSPAIMSAFAEKAGGTQRGRTMAFYGMSLAMANLVGFGLSGVIVSRLGYPFLFFFGAAMAAGGVLIALSLPRAPRHHDAAARGSFREEYGKVKSLLSRGVLLVSFTAIFAQYFAFGGVITLLPLWVKSLGMEAFHVGIVLAAFTVTFIALQFPSGMLSDRVGRLKMIYAGLALGTVSLVVLPMVTTFVMIALTMALYGAAFGLLFPSVSALIADGTLPAERGTANGIFHALLTAGVAVGAPVVGGVGALVGIDIGLTLLPLALAAALGFCFLVARK
ncbi:MAG: MFS transporter [Chloroflexota bacterium]